MSTSSSHESVDQSHSGAGVARQRTHSTVVYQGEDSQDVIDLNDLNAEDKALAQKFGYKPVHTYKSPCIFSSLLFSFVPCHSIWISRSDKKVLLHWTNHCNPTNENQPLRQPPYYYGHNSRDEPPSDKKWHPDNLI